MLEDIPCHCDSKKTFTMCCKPFLTFQKKPVTAEQLMRSRYSAFVLENTNYLLHSWHHNFRPNNIDFDSQTKWLGLKIKRCKAGLETDLFGWVEFVARFKIAGKAERIEELSYFIKEGDQWLYVSAENKKWEELL